MYNIHTYSKLTLAKVSYEELNCTYVHFFKKWTQSTRPRRFVCCAGILYKQNSRNI